MFSNKLEKQLEMHKEEYYTTIHVPLCNAVSVAVDTFVKCQDPSALNFKLIDENKLFDILLRMIDLNGVLRLYPKQLFDFSFYPKGFAKNLNSVKETMDMLVESVPKYKGTLSYVFLWDILLLEACHCELLKEEFFRCLKLQIGDKYEDI